MSTRYMSESMSTQTSDTQHTQASMSTHHTPESMSTQISDMQHTPASMRIHHMSESMNTRSTISVDEHTHSTQQSQ